MHLLIYSKHIYRKPTVCQPSIMAKDAGFKGRCLDFISSSSFTSRVLLNKLPNPSMYASISFSVK